MVVGGKNAMSTTIRVLPVHLFGLDVVDSRGDRCYEENEIYQRFKYFLVSFDTETIRIPFLHGFTVMGDEFAVFICDIATGDLFLQNRHGWIP